MCIKGEIHFGEGHSSHRKTSNQLAIARNRQANNSMSLVDVPYYTRQGPASASLSRNHRSRPPFISEAMINGPILDHRLANMGIYDDGSDDEAMYREVGPMSPVGSQASSAFGMEMPPFEDSSFDSFEMGMTPIHFGRLSQPPASLNRHLSRVRMMHHQFASDTLDLGESPFGATLSEEHGNYVIKAPTPGVPRERLVLEVVGCRRLELTVSPQPSEPQDTFDDAGSAAQEGKEEPSRHQREAAVATALKRSVILPHDSDVSGITCTYDNGVLRIDVPRVASEALIPGFGAVSGAQGELLEEAKEAKRRVCEARVELRKLEAAAKEADGKLRSSLREASNSHERVLVTV